MEVDLYTDMPCSNRKLYTYKSMCIVPLLSLRYKLFAVKIIA